MLAGMSRWNIINPFALPCSPCCEPGFLIHRGQRQPPCEVIHERTGHARDDKAGLGCPATSRVQGFAVIHDRREAVLRAPASSVAFGRQQ